MITLDYIILCNYPKCFRSFTNHNAAYSSERIYFTLSNYQRKWKETIVSNNNNNNNDKCKTLMDVF